MGLGKLLTRSIRYDVTNTVTGEMATFTIVDNLAPDWPTSGYKGGMAVPGAWRAATLLSDLLGSIPWAAYRQRAGGPPEALDPTPLLLEQPHPPDTRMTTFSSWALDLIWHGNAIGVIASRNREGWPTSALAVPAETVGVRRITDASQSWLPVGAIEYSIGTMRFGSDEVIHIKGPCEPGALRGMGVLEAHLNTLNLAHEQSRQARSLSQHGVPTGVLKSTSPDTTKDDMIAAKAAWLRSQRDRTVAALGPGTDFEPLSWNPEELQLVDARKFTLHELALIFGVPLSALGVETSNRTYRNDESEGINLLKFSLRGHLARFEQTLSLHLPRGTVAKANLDSVLRADTLTRYQAHEIGIRAGFLTLDEARELENRAPLPTQPKPPTPVQPVDQDQDQEEDQ